MKRLTTLSLALLVATIALAEGPRTAYCGITHSGTYAYLDNGQRQKRRNWIVDSNGETIHFYSIVGILNYMSERGWELDEHFTSYANVESTLTEENKINSKTIWLFRKEITTDEEILSGITTRQMWLDSNAE